MNSYETPRLKVLGTLEGMTEAFNKIGDFPDTFAANPNVVGSLVGVPSR